MAKAQHTSGTWKAYVYDTHYVITAPDTANHEVQIVHVVRDPVVLSDTWERQCADARRIVLEHNVCQGISDADLAGGVVAAGQAPALPDNVLAFLERAGRYLSGTVCKQCMDADCDSALVSTCLGWQARRLLTALTTQPGTDTAGAVAVKPEEGK